MRGLFVTLEGPDGSGKTTILERVDNRLRENGIEAVLTREPGGTPIAEKIRTVILDNANEGMGSRCEALLYAASRAEHTEKLILPAIERGELVLCDRYVLSSLAYQGAGRELGMQDVWNINSFATAGQMPDLVLFFDVDPLTVLNRKAKVTQQDRLEVAGNAFHSRVYEGYQEALTYADKVQVIDARQSIEDVTDAVFDAIKSAWEERSL